VLRRPRSFHAALWGLVAGLVIVNLALYLAERY